MNPDLLVTIAFCVYIVVVVGVAIVAKMRDEEPPRAGLDEHRDPQALSAE